MTAEAWILLGTLAAILAGGIATWAVSAKMGETASAKVDRLERDLSEFKEKVARDYATANMVAAVEARVLSAIDRLGDRLDRVFEVRSAGPRSRPPAK